jgi:hypothetical protein
MLNIEKKIFKGYKSHKVVGAAQVVSFVPGRPANDDSAAIPPSVIVRDETEFVYTLPQDIAARYSPIKGDYLVRYTNADGSAYFSFSPKAEFEAGYAPMDPPGRSTDFEKRLSAATSKPSDIAEKIAPKFKLAGYTDQSKNNIELVNNNKQIEEMVLQICDALLEVSAVDKRWLSIARTHIEQGFMALNRSIFKPERVKLSLDNGDKAASTPQR